MKSNPIQLIYERSREIFSGDSMSIVGDIFEIKSFNQKALLSSANSYLVDTNLVNSKGAVRLVDYSRSHLINLAKKGKINGYQYGGRGTQWMFDVESLTSYAKKKNRLISSQNR